MVEKEDQLIFLIEDSLDSILHVFIYIMGQLLMQFKYKLRVLMM